MNGIKEYQVEQEIMYCVYCAYDMTKTGFCVDCNEYKSAVTFVEYCQINETYPIYKGTTK